jgi:hypothetical protein
VKKWLYFFPFFFVWNFPFSFVLKFAQLQRKNVCHNTFSNLLLFDIFYLFILKVALFQALAARGHPTPVFQTLGML